MELVIERSKWLQGDNTNSMLYRESDKKMCCLGFLACKLGYDIDTIAGQGTPVDIREDESLFPSTIIHDGDNTPLCKALVKVNDDLDLKPRHREAILRELFKSIDIRVKFID